MGAYSKDLDLIYNTIALGADVGFRPSSPESSGPLSEEEMAQALNIGFEMLTDALDIVDSQTGDEFAHRTVRLMNRPTQEDPKLQSRIFIQWGRVRPSNPEKLLHPPYGGNRLGHHGLSFDIAADPPTIWITGAGVDRTQVTYATLDARSVMNNPIIAVPPVARALNNALNPPARNRR